MKQLSDFISVLNEAKRGRPRKVNMDKIEGKDAEKNGTDGLVGYNEPTDDSAVTPLDRKTMSKNMRLLDEKFDAEEDFFIQGRAGWGKTSIIESLAKQYKREVITVYLDKAQASDLGGIPVPVKGKKVKYKTVNGEEIEKEVAKQDLAMPDWAATMLENPNVNYLLFFDEMNQAQPDVMNALMPIVLEHRICNINFKNFFVGAAGNLEEENEGGVSELGGPLKSRFKPIIVWETNTDDAWKDSLNYLSGKWKSVFGDDLWEQIKECAPYFENPRELEHKLFKFSKKIKDHGREGYDADDFFNRLSRLAKDDIISGDQRGPQKKLQKLAESLYNWLYNKGQSSSRSRKSADAKLDEKKHEVICDIIKHGMKNGYFKTGAKIPGTDEEAKFGLSPENVMGLDFSEDFPDVVPEMIERYIRKLEAEGIQWKFKTDKEWKDAGYEDESDDKYQ